MFKQRKGGWLRRSAAMVAVGLLITMTGCGDSSAGSETTEFIDEGSAQDPLETPPTPRPAVVDTPAAMGTAVPNTGDAAGGATGEATAHAVQEGDAQSPAAEAEGSTEGTADGSSSQAIDIDGGGAVEVSFGNVAFQMESALANTVNAVQVAGTPNQADTPPGDEAPSHVLFTFIDYYPTDDAGLRLDLAPYQPQVIVYDTSAFGDYNIGEDGAIGFGPEMVKLQGLLDSQVELAVQETLPFLPLSNAVQGLHSNEMYMDFNGGRGIRYLAQYGQDVSPVIEGEMFYTFQGLSDDGRYYVAALFPVNTGVLPEGMPADLNPDQLVGMWEDYLASVREQLNGVAPADFTPSLEMLDSLVQSLTISGS